MKSTLGTLALATLMVVLLAPLADHVQGKSGPAKVTSLTADVTFRNGPGDGIWGGPTTATIYSDGHLSLVDSDPTGHVVVVSFANQTEPPLSPFNCREWALPPADPSFSREPAIDLATPTTVTINSSAQIEPPDSAHGWARKIESKTRSKTVYHTLNLLKDVPPGEKRYVELVIWLRLASTNDLYHVNFNRTWDADADWSGIFEVEAAKTNGSVSAKGDTFYIRPIPEGQPYPLPYLGQDEANLRVTLQPATGQDQSGVCTMGTYRMPFEMTVVRR